MGWGKVGARGGVNRKGVKGMTKGEREKVDGEIGRREDKRKKAGDGEEEEEAQTTSRSI